MNKTSLVIDQVAMVKGGNVLSLELGAGQAVAIMGRGGSGKSQLLRILSGGERPKQGKVRQRGRALLVSESILPKRGKTFELIGLKNEAANAKKIASALETCDLFESRNLDINKLSVSQKAAACFLPVWHSDANVILVDMTLDWLDVCVRKQCWDALSKLRNDGAIVLVSTHSPDIAAMCDGLIVLREQQFTYSGTLGQVMVSIRPHEIEIESDRSDAVRAMVEPFAIDIRQKGNRTTFSTANGQQLALQMLQKGYGDIKFVAVQEPSLEDVLLELL
jgi:ABC-type multidrug transport system ATPase subunit